MCQTPHARPSPSAMLANLRQPGSLDWKVRRLAANLASRLVHRQNCCGHAGEPGC